MSRRVAITLALAVWLVSSAGWSVDLDLEVRAAAEYDSNVLGTATEERGDYALRINPSIGLEDRDGNATWKLVYAPYYRQFVEVSQASGWSHVVTGELGWRLTPTLQLDVTDRFADVSNLDLLEQDLTIQDVIDTPETEFGEKRTTRNRFGASLAWSLGAADTLTFGIDHTYTHYQGRRGDTMLVRGTLDWLRRLTPRQQMGVSLAASLNEVSGLGAFPDRSSSFYNLSGTWNYRITETLLFQAQAGPTLVVGEALEDPASEIPNVPIYPRAAEGGRVLFRSTNGCGLADGSTVLGPECGTATRSGGPQGLTDGLTAEEQLVYGGTQTIRRVGRDPRQPTTNVTWFANISLAKTWEKVTGRLSFVRQDATAFSSFGSSTVANIFTASLDWKPEERWHLGLTASYVSREQDNEVVATAADVTSVSLVGCSTLFAGAVDCGPQYGRFNGVAQTGTFRAVTTARNLTQDQYIVVVRAAYDLRRNITLSASASYRLLQEDGDFPGRLFVDRSRWRVAFNVRYRFDPIHL